MQSLIDEGRITEEEARVHPHRNLILRAVDGVHEPEPDLFTLEAAPGDRLLLCSDGCSGVPRRRPRSREILGDGHRRATRPSSWSAPPSPPGSSDNVTVVVADVVEDDDEADAVRGPLVVGAAAEAPQRGAR